MFSAFLYTCWLSICSKNYWVRSVKIPATIMDLSVSSYSSISFVSSILKFFYLLHKCLGLLCPLDELTLLSLWNNSLSLVIFFALKSTLLDINRVYPDFLWLVFPCCIIFHLVNFTLFLSVYLKWISLEAICGSFLLLYINW